MGDKKTVANANANVNVNVNANAGEVGQEAEVMQRGQWGNHLEFVLTIVGYAVGLGNVWRFPYLAFNNGGGAFLVPYVIMLILCGVPVFFLELCFGQFASLGPLAIWTVNPFMKGLGFAMTVTSMMVTMTYHILLSYIIYFFFASMNSEVPWANCDNKWNTYKCLTTDQIRNTTYFNWYLDEFNLTRDDLKSPSEEYYYDEVLKISGSVDEMGGIVWQLAVTLFLAWLIVFIVLIKGIESLGKVVYFTTIFPYLMMTVMVIRGATLDGALDGIIFYLKPDFNKLGNAQVWSDAASQIFYSLSTCSGGLIAMSSYNQFHNNVLRDSTMVPIINALTSLYAGFSIFSVLGFMAKLKGVPVDKVAQGGPGLVFVVYPEGLSQMPVAPVWSVLFFFMMVTLGFSSAFSMVESIIVAYLDEFADIIRTSRQREIIFRAVFCATFYLISLPMVTNGGFYIFNIIDTYCGGLPRLFTGIFELIAVIWMYGLKRFSEDVALMLGKKPNIYFKATWTVISPLVIAFILVSKVATHTTLELFNRPYPQWADNMGWGLVGFVTCWIPLGMIYRWMVSGGYQALKEAIKPLPNWGPADPVNRTGKYADYDLRDTFQHNGSDYGNVALGKSGSHYDLSRLPSRSNSYADFQSGPFTIMDGSMPDLQNGLVLNDLHKRPIAHINNGFVN